MSLADHLLRVAPPKAELILRARILNYPSNADDEIPYKPAAQFKTSGRWSELIGVLFSPFAVLNFEVDEKTLETPFLRYFESKTSVFRKYLYRCVYVCRSISGSTNSISILETG